MLGCGFLHRDLEHLSTEEAQIEMCLSRAPGTCKLASPQIDYAKSSKTYQRQGSLSHLCLLPRG